MPPTYEELQEQQKELQERIQQLEQELRTEKDARAEERRQREELQNAVNLLIDQQVYESWLAERRLLQSSIKTCLDKAITVC